MMEKTERPEVNIVEGLIEVSSNAAPFLFANAASIKSIINLIEKEVTGHEVDLTSNKGRKAVASMAMKVSKSKVILDKLGKDLVTDWKDKANLVDAARKIARDDLDALRDKVRKPLTDWEENEDREAQIELDALRVRQDHDNALDMNELFNLRKKAEEQEAELARLRNIEFLKKAEDEKEKKRIEREERIRIEATERAEKNAEEKIRKAQEETERKIKEEKHRLDRERVAEEYRISKELEEKKIKADNLRHQGQFNRFAAADFEKFLSISSAEAKGIVTAIVSGKIRNITMNY